MFRQPLALRAASLCGLVAAVAFFVIGWNLTARFGRWDPYAAVDWQQMMTSAPVNFGADFFLHSFIALAAMAALFFFLALGARLYRGHPTSTVTGLGFLGLAVGVLTIYNVWAAFGKDLVVLRYRSTSDEALRQTLQHLYQAGFLDVPVITGIMAYFALVGFIFLGNAFRGQGSGRVTTAGCWLSAAGLLFAVLALSYGYDRMFAASEFHRTLMMAGQVGLWLLPSITIAWSAAWLWLATGVPVSGAEAPPSLQQAA